MNTTVVGGAGLVAAAALQSAAALQVIGLLDLASNYSPWCLAASIVGGSVMLIASVLLGNGRSDMPGIVGSSVVGRIALVVFGADGLLGLAVSGVASASGSNRDTAVAIGFVVARLLGATTVTAVAVARERRVSGAVSGALVLLVLGDLVSTVLLVARSTPLAFLACAYLARPALVAVLGVALTLPSTSAKQLSNEGR